MQKEKKIINNWKCENVRLDTAVNSSAWSPKNYELNKVAYVSSMAQGSCWSASHLYVLNSEKEERKETPCSSIDPSWNAGHLKCMSMSHTSSLLHLEEGAWAVDCALRNVWNVDLYHTEEASEEAWYQGSLRHRAVPGAQTSSHEVTIWNDTFIHVLFSSI